MTATRQAPELTDQELETWRRYLVASRLLFDELDRCLNEDAGISLPDYGLLSRLADAGEVGLRMSELADSSVFSRSRLSHAVDRLEDAGWVERRSCPTDRRGSYAALTAAGREKLGEASPIHASVIRRHLLDPLTSSQTAALTSSMERIGASLGGSLENHC